MQTDYTVHDRKYQEARAKGWSGWGGNERMALEHIWLERLFSCDELPAEGRVLELGCGEGHYARRLAQKGYAVVGADVSPVAIEWAKEKSLNSELDVEFLVADLTQPGVLRGESFDVVVDGNCLHCIIGADRAIFLANVRRLLRFGGIFFISSLCSSTDEDSLVEFEGRPYRSVLTQEHLLAEIEAAGFGVLDANFHRNEGHSHCSAHLVKK